MKENNAPRHRGHDAKGAGGVVFGDGGHLTRNKTESKSPRPRVDVGDHVHIIMTRPGDLWWWVPVKPGQPSDAVIGTALRFGVGVRGPFRTQQEAEADFLGPNCTVHDGGVFDPEWERLQ